MFRFCTKFESFLSLLCFSPHFLKTNRTLPPSLWSWFSEERDSPQTPTPETLAAAPPKMKWLPCLLIWLFSSEARGFEIPTNGLPEVSTSRRLLAAGLHGHAQQPAHSPSCCRTLLCAGRRRAHCCNYGNVNLPVKAFTLLHAIKPPTFGGPAPLRTVYGDGCSLLI